jgi:hypothetical protein
MRKPISDSADHGHHAADALRARGAGEDRHAERHQHAAAEPLKDAEADQRLGRPGEPGEHRAADEQRDRGHVEALGPEAIGGPAGERDDRRERERVAGRHPLDRREGGVELTGERVDRHVDDGHVEDRHDRAEHDDPGDHHQRMVEPFAVGRGSGGSHPFSG